MESYDGEVSITEQLHKNTTRIETHSELFSFLLLLVFEKVTFSTLSATSVPVNSEINNRQTKRRQLKTY